MAGSISPTPANPYVKGIADVLRKAKKLNVDTPSFTPFGIGEKVIDFMLPESGINEIEDWAYGNYPVQVPEMTNVPQFKRNKEGSRAGAVLDAAGLLPVGTALKGGGAAASQAGLLIPVLRGRRAAKSAGLQSDLERAVLAAEDLKSKGATRRDIWNDVKLAEVDRLDQNPRGPFEAKWLHEMSREPGAPLFSPYASMATNDKIDWLTKNYPQLLKSNAGEEAESMVENTLLNQMLIPGEYKLDEALDHPAFEQYPLLAEGKLRFMTDVLDKDPRIAMRPGGSFYRDLDLVDVNQGTGLQGPYSEFNPTQVIQHELQHAVQAKMGMPRGGNVPEMTTTPEQDTAMLELVDALRSRT
jgi:hypothetical protein